LTTIDRSTPIAELAACVSSELRARGVDVVLSGGAAVSIYSDNAYESYDLDFVPVGLARKVDGAMCALGFAKRGRHWVHSLTPYWVDFPPGPVGVGREIIHEFAEIENAGGVLRILRPTECVMDRLTWVIHGGDPQCLEQAVAVARRHAIDRDRIERWAEAEGPEGPRRFVEFLARLS